MSTGAAHTAPNAAQLQAQAQHAQQAHQAQQALQAQQAQQAQAQAMLARQQEEDARRRKAEELRRALEEAPKLDVPWQLLEASASKARIRALAKTLDPTMELDDGAVQVRVGCFLPIWI